MQLDVREMLFLVWYKNIIKFTCKRIDAVNFLELLNMSWIRVMWL